MQTWGQPRELQSRRTARRRLRELQRLRGAEVTRTCQQPPQKRFLRFVAPLATVLPFVVDGAGPKYSWSNEICIDKSLSATIEINVKVKT
jgi:hypothetical protein